MGLIVQQPLHFLIFYQPLPFLGGKAWSSSRSSEEPQKRVGATLPYLFAQRGRGANFRGKPSYLANYHESQLARQRATVGLGIYLHSRVCILWEHPGIYIYSERTRVHIHSGGTRDIYTLRVPGYIYIYSEGTRVYIHTLRVPVYIYSEGTQLYIYTLRVTEYIFTLRVPGYIYTPRVRAYIYILWGSPGIYILLRVPGYMYTLRVPRYIYSEGTRVYIYILRVPGYLLCGYLGIYPGMIETPGLVHWYPRVHACTLQNTSSKYATVLEYIERYS